MRGLCLGNEDNTYGADVAVTEEYVDAIRETFSENKGIVSQQTIGYRMKRNPRVGSFDESNCQPTANQVGRPMGFRPPRRRSQ